jgi:hypothetical protein
VSIQVSKQPNDIWGPEPNPDIGGRLQADIWNAIVHDRFMFITIWAPPRLGKTTLAGWLLYSIYRDWQKMLQATVFSLPQVLHRLRNGLPELWPTSNGLHWRVPILNWDDFGAHSNKAETQYDQAFDLFKGGFDVLGTKLGVLVLTMVDPNEPTFQLLCKYTHEIQVTDKGQYKYDKVEWQQNFHGFKTRIRKIPIEPGVFDNWPPEIYKEYDQSRMSLADEVFVRIDDAVIESSIERTIKLLKPKDIELLRTIDELGPISHDKAKDLVGKETIVRGKAREIVMSYNKGSGHYNLELSELGRQILMALDKKDPEEEIKKQKW